MSPPPTEFKMIVALCRGGGIGNNGCLPWCKIARDLRFFSEMTRSSTFPYRSAVVMGRKTWESIPANSRPLPFRDNFIVSALHTARDNEQTSAGVTFLRNLSEIHKYTMNYDHVWFIGGASIYEQVVANQDSFPIDDIYITFVDEEYECDTGFPLTFQYDSVEEWESHIYDLPNRAIWCWTGTEFPKYISFFADNSRLFRVTDVDRDFVASITRPGDLKAIQERRVPDTVFLQVRSAAHHRPGIDSDAHNWRITGA
jgi:dihydrofolate reductase